MARTGHEVEYSAVIKGASVGGGSYVLLSQDELDEIAPGQSRSLDMGQFVDSCEVDPIYFSKACFLGSGDDATKKAYALLREAMGRTGRAAIASFVMRTKEYLAAVRADGGLVLETLFFADEIRDPRQEISNLPGRVDLSSQEVQMARQLIEAMTGPWNPADYRGAYTDRSMSSSMRRRTRRSSSPQCGPRPPPTWLT
jgi:DNA end-binding protein Ku